MSFRPTVQVALGSSALYSVYTQEVVGSNPAPPIALGSASLYGLID